MMDERPLDGELSRLGEILKRDLPMEETEAAETELKALVAPLFAGRVPAGVARRLAAFQSDCGFVLKYKSYAVKAATPLGYSVFLQRPGQGFSFQQHTRHKTEVFHILERLPGGYVFLCRFEDWRRHYEPDRFRRWLAGAKDSFFDERRFVPDSGDVFVISELGVVHTVVGCVLEEFATVSTDMVERLHDQNAGRPIPPLFTRSFTETELRRLRRPESYRRVEGAHWGTSAIEAAEERGVRQSVLADSFVRASRYVVSRGSAAEVAGDDGRAASLMVQAGVGSLQLEEEAPLEAGPGAVFLIPPGIGYRLRNAGSEDLCFTEHRIDPALALHRDG